MAHPGTLPAINREAVHHVIRMGKAVGGAIADYTEFDRKNYFYPDIPKGYQISQFKYPLISGGELAGVAITRIHLEEDTARSQHVEGKTLVDYNRAGVPLMELVTEPVIHDAQTAGKFARELQLLLRALGASEANMEEGQMRVEANISVSKSDVFGTKVEIKNLNSFRSVERAIEFEIERQSTLIESGGSVVQETRGWDENSNSTFSQRKKESSHDYRYFPDPDLPKLYLSKVSEFADDVVKASLPELPWKKRERYMSLGLKAEDAEMFVRDIALSTFFDQVVAHNPSNATLAANYLTSDITGLIESGKIKSTWLGEQGNAVRFGELISMVASDEVSSRAAKNILEMLTSDARSAREIAQSEGLFQKHDASELEEMAKKIIEANPKVVSEYKAGKGAALQFLLGQGMKESKGAANPKILKEVFENLLV